MRRFFLGIILPSILAIVLFIISFYLFYLPSLERNIMEGKKKMISELTNSVVSIISDYASQAADGVMSDTEARIEAAEKVERIRYGDDDLDYFWIIDMTPVMIMHPYRPDLVGKDLSDYRDPQGKRLFVESVETVREEGEGYIDYYWQWKDDSLTIVPKLSYVRGIPEWNWVVGTGIYLEDVREEIRLAERNLFRISLLIVLVVSMMLLYIIRQSMKMESGRREAEKSLVLSKQKYKMLVESSTIGTIMVAGDNRVIYVNQKFLDISGFTRTRIEEEGIDDLFNLSRDEIMDSVTENGRSSAIEAVLKSSSGDIDIILSVSRVDYNNDHSYIIIVNELTGREVAEKEREALEDDLRLYLVLINQPVSNLIKSVPLCDMDTSAARAAGMLRDSDGDILVVLYQGVPTGVVTAGDISKRVVAGGYGSEHKVSSVMSSPVIGVTGDTPVYKAIALCQSKNISGLAVRDNSGRYTGMVTLESLLMTRHHLLTDLTGEIAMATRVDDLKEIYLRSTAIVKVLIELCASPAIITRLISLVSDRISCRVTELAIEKLGPPPASYCILAMGSQGRHEQTLLTDQDNGIIIEDGESCGDEVLLYFRRLGKMISDDLHRIGYHYCRGDVMASNPEWVRPLNVWKRLFSEWIENSDPNSVLDTNIFFDFRGICGDVNLAASLREHVTGMVSDKAVFLFHMSQEILRFKPPVNIFGHIVGEKDGSEGALIDIKKLMLQLTGFGRLYSLKSGITETNTPKRFSLIRDNGVLPGNITDPVQEAYSILSGFRLRRQAESMASGEEASNSIALGRLTEIEASALRKIISLLSDLSVRVSLDFKGTVT
jgi:PAS domain S-box-containing protein